MTDREKLIELLVDVPVNYELCMRIMGVCPTIETPCYECLADYLLSKGVMFATDTTVGRKWISVEDRLPECDCLAYSSKSGLMTVGYIEPYWRNGGTEYICANGLEPLFDVTHWMPLHEPPKED